jgi:hypothetical protein
VSARPWEIVLQNHPKISPEVLLCRPVLLERTFERDGVVGQDVLGLEGPLLNRPCRVSPPACKLDSSNGF